MAGKAAAGSKILKKTLTNPLTPHTPGGLSSTPLAAHDLDRLQVCAQRRWLLSCQLRVMLVRPIDAGSP
jgi:hypothetical protein